MASLGFDKNLATYQWNGLVRMNTSSDADSLMLDERFRSMIIIAPRKLVRDEQSLNFRAKHGFGKLSAVVRGSNFVLSDDQKFTDGLRPSVTTASSNALYGGVEAEIFRSVFVEPLVGMRFDNQTGVRDQGVSYTLGAWSPGLGVGGYQSRFEGRFQRDMLEPRTLERRSLTAGVGKTFFEGVRDTLDVGYFSNQRDFYFPADTTTMQTFNITQNIERRIEDVLTVSNVLEYSVGQQVTLSLQGNLSSRSIDRQFRYRPLAFLPSQTLVNTTVDEFRIGGITQLRYAVTNDFFASVLLHFNERDERHTVERDERISPEIDQRQRDEAKKDNLTRRTMLASLVDAVLSRYDTIRFTGSASLLRYDTPSGDNIDDRDELWYAVNLTTLHRLSDYLYLRFTIDANLIHLVYLHGERSANNTWNRVFRVAPRVHYAPTRDFSTTNTFEVLANYTVYDFENTPLVQVTSFSFRQFALIDSTRWRLTPRLAVDGFAHVRLYQRGELRWDEFRERPLNYFEDKTFIGKIEYELERHLLFSVGVRYFNQIRFSYVGGKRVFETVLKSIGPLGRIQWEAAERSQVIIDGWYERQTQTNALPRSFTNMTMSINVRL